MSYFTTLTNTGLAKITDALANGTTITMSEMSVGDGDGLPVSPSPTQTALVNEKFRASINQVSLNQDDNLVAELIIPASSGGFGIREIGLWDDDGDLFAVGSLPHIEKPDPLENSVAELVLRMIVAVSNSETINLTVDTSTVTATQEWVEANFTAAALFPGGTTGQILAKQSNLDGDTEWKDPTDVNVVVDIIEEEQVLADSQTVVTLTTVTTEALAVYIEGNRLPRSAWVADTATQLTLNSSYPADTEIYMVQNEPAGLIQHVKVGQIIMLGLTTTPSQLFGYGTWQRVAEGRALFGYDAADSDFNTLGKIGGSKTHSHSGTTATAGSHTHSGATANHTLTESQIPSHSHSGQTGSDGSHNHTGSALSAGSHSHTLTLVRRDTDQTGNDDRYGPEGVADGSDNLTTSSAGSHTHTLSISSNGIHSHTFTTETTGGSTGHSHGISSDGTHSHTFNTGTASSLPPYFTVAAWQRLS